MSSLPAPAAGPCRVSLHSGAHHGSVLVTVAVRPSGSCLPYEASFVPKIGEAPRRTMCSKRQRDVVDLRNATSATILSIT